MSHSPANAPRACSPANAPRACSPADAPGTHAPADVPSVDELALRTPPATEVRTLVDEFLADQAATTAVDRFSQVHDRVLAGGPATRSGTYRDLMPATPPAEGQQYAFEVDLDACSGCKACVVACGSLNGLPAGTSFRDTGTLVGQPADGLPILREVTAACHHCVEPGCLQGCPSKAYEKDPATGVVTHLDDQCIGCRYCTLMCPYEVPKYDADRGIVRKCDLCHDRLAEGEAPACVQACPTEAISVRVVDLEEVTAAAAEPWAFPAPDPATTVPSTRYRTSERLDVDVAAVDLEALRPAHAHPPLTVMLVLTQLAVGTVLALLAAPALPTVAAGGPASVPVALTGLAAGVVALAASVLHLGRPLQAWRAVLGLRRSWLSREIVAFGLFAPATAAYAGALAGMPPLASVAGPLGVAAAVTGLAGVGTSVMVYAATGRAWWSLRRVAARFAATTALGGLATLLAVLTVTGAVLGAEEASAVAWLASGLTLVAGGVATADLLLARHRHGPPEQPLARTARLLTRQLRGLLIARLTLLGAGAVVAPWLAWVMLTQGTTSATAAAVCAVAALVAVLGAELLERWRFFTAVAPRRMPGRLP
jgi:formate dehydrogenase iron-sulfur subunit